MGSKYQQIGNYDGSLYGIPQHHGIEYDWEIPDHAVVGSPGGVSSVHHHPTKGFYGRGNTSSDIFAGMGQGYLAGGFGNLYETGHNAIYSEQMYSDPPDYQHWQHQEPQQHSFSQFPHTSKMPETENYESGHDSSFELIDSDNYSSNDSVEGYSNGTNIGVKTKMSPWLVLLLILFIFVVIFLWTKTGNRFIVQYLNEGRKPSWQKMVVYSLVATVVLIIILYTAGFPEISFE